jgi:hypothetical protein
MIVGCSPDEEGDWAGACVCKHWIETGAAMIKDLMMSRQVICVIREEETESYGAFR